MRIKKCSCCGKDHTTKTAQYIGRQRFGAIQMLLWNCPVCRSTMAIRNKPKVVA